MTDAQYDTEAVRIVKERIADLRRLSFAEAAAMPEASGEDILVAGRKASVTVFRQLSPYHLEGKVLITVLVARERWFGMAAHHTERGLVFSAESETRDATETELQNSGG